MGERHAHVEHRLEDCKWVAHDHNGFVAAEVLVVDVTQRIVTLYDPNPVVYHMLPDQTLEHERDDVGAVHI